MDDQGCAGAVHRQVGLGVRVWQRAMGCPGCVAALAWRRDFVVLAVVGTWRLGGGGAGLAAFLLRFVLFFVVTVVDVPVVQVVDVGVQFLDTVVDLPVVVQVVALWSRQCSPWSSAVAVLGQGGDMPVVSTTGARRCRRCSSCGCGRPCDYAATSGLANSGGASNSVHRAV